MARGRSYAATWFAFLMGIALMGITVIGMDAYERGHRVQQFAQSDTLFPIER